jgi:hypothetical protein
MSPPRGQKTGVAAVRADLLRPGRQVERDLYQRRFP